MPDSIDPDVVQRVAKLAKIALAPEQLQPLTQQMGAIVGYVDQLQNVPLPEDCRPFFGGLESSNAMREDGVTPSHNRQQVLKNSPDSDGEFFQVPSVFD